MTITEYQNRLEPIKQRAERDGDAILVVAFSREEDAYQGFEEGMDAGDALIVVQDLVEALGLMPEIVAGMAPAQEDL